MERLGDQDACIVPSKSRELPHLKIGSSVLKADFDEGDDFYREKTKNELRETPEVVEQALKDFKAMYKGTSRCVRREDTVFNTLPTASGSTAYARPTDSMPGADSLWHRLCFGLDSPIPFFSFIANDEPDLFVPDDNEFCRKFLRPCKWYPKSAFELMKRFYKFKANNPRYCLNLLPSNEKKVLSSDIVVPLPDRMADGCRVFQINCGKAWNAKVISIDEIFRSIILSLEAAMAEPKTQIAGIHVILNMDGLTLNHVTHITPSFAASVTDWVQRCLPCRLKGIHVVNQPFIFNMVYAIFKPFLLEKTRKRLHFHGTNRDTLLSFINAKALPVEFGGELEMPNESIGQGVCDYFCWFEKDFEAASKYGYVKSTK